jgi:cation diffusion facilitator CzcD-associated flavoprotein CzcO
MSNPSAVVVGAGPFGVSVAAHLRHHGIDFRIFGKPMHRWRAQMPKGMLLKSESFASDLAEPTGRYTLEAFCEQQGIPCGNDPVPVETFNRYALSFQQYLVPMVEDVSVIRIDCPGALFELRLATGEIVRTPNVVIATGLSHVEHIPQELAGLPSDLLSHTSNHHDLSSLKGRDVVVIGAGQSALETAALLHEQQANPILIVRGPSVEWNAPPTFAARSFWDRVRRPASPLGNGIQTWFCAKTPMLFYRLPQQKRIELVRRVLGPAGAYWLRDRVLGRMPILHGRSVRSVDRRDGRAVVQVVDRGGKSEEVSADHIIAGTGYRFVARRLPFLGPPLLDRLRCVNEAPWVSPTFESSVPGLYFTGLACAYNFGPVMRFLCGTRYTARQVCGAIVRNLGDRSSRVHATLTPAANRKPT